MVMIKQCETSICIYYIIVWKFDNKQGILPGYFFSINKYTKIGLNYVVLPLNLTVCLLVEGNKKLLFDTKKMIQQKQNFDIKFEF